MTSTPDPRNEDIDARFAEIMAHWDADEPVPGHDAPSAGPVLSPPEPATESADLSDLARPSTPITPAPHEPSAADRRPTPPPVDAGWRSYEVEEDDSFEPPALKPLPHPRRDPWFWVTALGLGGGGLALIVLGIFAPGTGGMLAWIAALAFLGGFGVLVWRSRDTSREREGWEDDSGVQL